MMQKGSVYRFFMLVSFVYINVRRDLKYRHDGVTACAIKT